MFAPIFACLMGCGAPVSVVIDATAAPDAKRETHFTIIASDPNVGPRNPDLITFSKAVTRALTADGFEPAAKAGDGDLLVVIDWMISDPKVVARHVGSDSVPAIRGGAGGAGHPVGGTPNHAAFGMGVEAQDKGDLLYTRTFTLKAVDRAAYKADPATKPLWSMTLVSEGDSDQPAEFGPAMVAVAMPYMAQNAGRVKAWLGMSEAPVKYVRGDIPNLPVKK